MPWLHRGREASSNRDICGVRIASPARKAGAMRRRPVLPTEPWRGRARHPRVVLRISPTSLLAQQQRRASFRGTGPSMLHRQQPLAHQSAIACARGQLLAHIAALLPIDGVELVETVLQQDGFLRNEVAAPRRAHPSVTRSCVIGRRQPASSVAPSAAQGLRMCARACGRIRRRPSVGQARVDIGDAAAEGAHAPCLTSPDQARRLMAASFAEQHGHAIIGGGIGDRDLGAQAVHRQPLDQVGAPIGAAQSTR